MYSDFGDSKWNDSVWDAAFQSPSQQPLLNMRSTTCHKSADTWKGQLVHLETWSQEQMRVSGRVTSAAFCLCAYRFVKYKL